MKVRSMQFGNDYRTQRNIPGVNGAVTELYVGQVLKSLHGRPNGAITGMELDRPAQLVLVHATDTDGKPYRAWTNNSEVRPHELADFIGVPLEGSVVRFEDDEKPAAAKGK
jgi:hypothetical protein